jgi:hypothetical protein
MPLAVRGGYGGGHRAFGGDVRRDERCWTWRAATYWNQLVLVKVVACYVRRYRDEQGRWINWIGIFKAVVTSSTIGAWAIWKDYAFVWAVLFGVAQLLDAAKDYIPQTKHRRSAV